MSWWVKEISTITEDQSERLCIIEVDTPSDLPNPVRTKPDPENPGQTITDYTIVRGSEAYCLSNSVSYKLNSSGQWVEQKSGQEIEIGADDIIYDNTDSGLTATNVQDAIDELESENDTQDNALAELYGEQAKDQILFQGLINKGAKNLLNNSEAYSQVVGGVTFTFNSDGTITANGTKTNNNWFILSTGNSLKAGTYVLSDGLPVDTVNCQLFLSTTNSFSTAIMSTGANSRPVTKTLTQDYSGLYYAIRIASGTVVNNLTFYPMLCTKAEWDVTHLYEPYAPTNWELYETKAEKGTFDITLADSPLSVSEYSYSAIVTGDIITICVRLVLSDTLAVNSSRNLFKIPAGFYPPVACAGTGYADNKLRQFWINTSGDIKIRIDEAIPTGASINANFCYSYKAANWTTVTSNQLQSLNSPLNLNRNDLNEQLDTNFDLMDSIQEEEEGDLDDI